MATDLCVEELVVFLELVFGEDGVHLLDRGLDDKGIYRSDKLLLVFEMLEEEVLDKVAGLTVVFRIHCHLAEEILHVRSLDTQRTETVPEVIKSEKSLCTGLAALIFRSDEASAELNGIR